MKWNLPQSEIDDWIHACQQAYDSDEVFASFRRMNAVTWMAESHHAEHVIDLWNAAHALWPEMNDLAFLPKLSAADKLGSPLESDVGMVGSYPISGTTANSVFRVAQIKHLFGDQPFDLAEIGGGYGNFAMVMALTNSLKSYSGFDLKEPSLLQEKYFNRQGFIGIWPALRRGELNYYDLSFSQASLNELDDAALEHYAERVLRRSKRGFHVWCVDPRWPATPDETLEKFRALMRPVQVEYRDGVYVWGIDE